MNKRDYTLTLLEELKQELSKGFDEMNKAQIKRLRLLINKELIPIDNYTTQGYFDWRDVRSIYSETVPVEAD